MITNIITNVAQATITNVETNVIITIEEYYRMYSFEWGISLLCIGIATGAGIAMIIQEHIASKKQHEKIQKTRNRL